MYAFPPLIFFLDFLINLKGEFLEVLDNIDKAIMEEKERLGIQSDSDSDSDSDTYINTDIDTDTHTSSDSEWLFVSIFYNIYKFIIINS